MKMQDIAPFGVRMPDELKKQLEYEAKKNQRSLNSEVVTRLQDSLTRPHRIPGVREADATYKVHLTDHEKALLAIFKKMSPEKQLALISLFK